MRHEAVCMLSHVLVYRLKPEKESQRERGWKNREEESNNNNNKTKQSKTERKSERNHGAVVLFKREGETGVLL